MCTNALQVQDKPKSARGLICARKSLTSAYRPDTYISGASLAMDAVGAIAPKLMIKIILYDTYMLTYEIKGFASIY